MALTITHSKVSGAGPASDPSKVGGDDWDAEHVVVGVPYIVDLGVIEVADVLAGVITVYAVPADRMVLELYLTDVTLMDSTDLYVYCGVDGLIARITTSGTSRAENPSRTLGTDVQAAYYTNGFTPVAWAPATAYSTDDSIVEAGHIWSGDGGTSGGSEPDFAGNIGGSVSDNGMTWNDQGAVPTTGSAHVYALVVEP